METIFLRSVGNKLALMSSSYILEISKGKLPPFHSRTADSLELVKELVTLGPTPVRMPHIF